MNFIPHELVAQIMNSQNSKLTEIDNLIKDEITYIKEALIIELQKNIGEICKNPFNHFVTVPFKNYNPNCRIFIERLKKIYLSTFQHSLQVGKDGYIVLITSNHFYQQADPRPQDLKIPPAQKMDSPEDTSADLKMFSEKEKTEYENKLNTPKPIANSFLQASSRRASAFPGLDRRNSKIYTPSLNSARDHSVSET